MDGLFFLSISTDNDLAYGICWIGQKSVFKTLLATINSKYSNINQPHRRCNDSESG